MIDARVFQNGMNIDSAPELLPSGQYTYGRNITVGSDGVKNVLGNRVLTAISAPVSGTDWICGTFHDRKRNKVLYFVYNSAGYHRIVSVDASTEASTVLFTNRTNTGGVDIFGWGSATGWRPDFLIKDIRIVYRDFGGDLVYFIDPLKRPLKFNIETLTSGGYGTVTLDMWKVIKIPPTTVPTCYYDDAAGRSVNNLKKKLFMFSVQFVYDDEETTVWSPKSKIPLPPQQEDGQYYADGTKANVIRLTVPTGIPTVKKINIAARVNVNSVWSDYFLIDTLDKESLSIPDNGSYEYSFYNDGAYNLVDIEESGQLFDYVPDEANCMELANGNALVYGGIVEGFDKEVDLDVSVVTGSEIPSVATLFYNVANETPRNLLITLTGTPVAGDVVRIEFNYDSSGTPYSVDYSYTVLLGDTIDDIIDYFVSQINTNHGTFINAANSTSPDDSLDISGNSINEILYGLVVTITTSSAPSVTDSGSCLKWKGRYKYSLHYANDEGKTRGVYVSGQQLTVDMPAYSEDTGNAETPYVEISINNAPPSWATHYFFVRTKELTSLRSLFVLTQVVAEDTDYAYISIQNLTTHGDNFPSSAGILAYDFANGDRVRFIKNQTTSTILNSYDYEILGVVDYTISAVSQRCIKIKKVAGMPSFATTATSFYVEIFSPAPIFLNEAENFYYEIGERYSITQDVNGNRVHSGNVQSQIIGSGSQPSITKLSDGDYYFRVRSLTINDAGDLDDYQCMDLNFSDYWESAVWSQGRALVIDESIRKQYYPAMLRFSLAYIYGTNVNQLSRFYPENFEEADTGFGDILRLKTRENFIRMFQRFKTGMIPIYRQIYTDTAGSSQVALSERLLNKPNYYAGEYGIDKYGLSLVSTDYGDYFLDTLNKDMIRVSTDGVTNVSEVYNVRDWFNANVNENSYGFGTFDYDRKAVIMAVGTMNTVYDHDVIAYRESGKYFESFYGYTSCTQLLFVNGKLWSFFGRPYIHDSATRNNFYGVQDFSEVYSVFNEAVNVKKTYTAVEQLSTDYWTCVMNTGALGNQQTNAEPSDFIKTDGTFAIARRENKFNAPVMRDVNSAGGKYFGETMKGTWISVQFKNTSTSEVRLISVTLKYIISQLTNN